MKKKNSVSIVGCSIPSLYAGIKCVKMGYSVIIHEKYDEIQHSDLLSYHNLKIYNSNHELYINLLKLYRLHGEQILNIKYNKTIFCFIESIIDKSKFIPESILISQNLLGLCRSLGINIDEFRGNASFDFLFNKISAFDCLNIFKSDIVNNSTYYYIKNEVLHNLLTMMKNEFELKGGQIIYNSFINNIRYIKKKFNLVSQLCVYQSDYIITSISKTNLQVFTFWNNDQRKLLNAVTQIPISHINIMMENVIHIPDISIIEGTKPVHKMLLNDLHVVYPIIQKKQKYVYLWKINVNNIFVSEKIKNIYNDKFLICSESFSKNNMFVNYSLEYVNSILNSLQKNCRH